MPMALILCFRSFFPVISSPRGLAMIDYMQISQSLDIVALDMISAYAGSATNFPLTVCFVDL